MKSLEVRLILLCLFFILFASFSIGTENDNIYPISDDIGKKYDEAYAMILNDDSLLSAIRVVHKSIQEHSTSYRPFIVLLSDRVSERSKKILKEDGFIMIKDIPSSKGDIYPYIYLWNLEQYGIKQLVYLSTNIIIKKSIDNLFKCKTFCATSDMTIPDDFNLAFLSFTTDNKIYKEMINNKDKILKKAYDVTPQAFLNSYFDWRKAIYLGDTELDKGDMKEGMYRLPVHWNAFDPIYYTYPPSWEYMVKKGLKIVQYSLGPKPWQWYTYPLFDLNNEWYHYFNRLPLQSITPDLIPILNITIPLILTIITLYVIGKQRIKDFNKDMVNTLYNNYLMRKLFSNFYIPFRLRFVGLLSCFLTLNSLSTTFVLFEFFQSNEWDPYTRWLMFYSWSLFTVSITLVSFYKMIHYRASLDNVINDSTNKEEGSESEEEMNDAVTLNINNDEEGNLEWSNKSNNEKTKKPLLSGSSFNPVLEINTFRPRFYWIRSILCVILAPIAYLMLIWLVKLIGKDLAGHIVCMAVLLLLYGFLLLRVAFDTPLVAVFKVYERKYGQVPEVSGDLKSH
ncbi:hypothetical protein ABK040_010048 [Willaertia magna]